MARVLLAGESWISQATHYKGFDSFSSTTFHTGADAFIAAEAWLRACAAGLAAARGGAASRCTME